MSSAVCENLQPSMAFPLDGAVGGARCGGMGIALRAAVHAAASPDQWLAQQEDAIQKESADKKDGQFDIWASIQSSKKEANTEIPSAPYVHPLVRRSGSSLSQKSLEICTESLGSETGSEGMLSSDDLDDYFSAWKTDEEELVARKKPEAAAENYDDVGVLQDDEEGMEEHVEPMPPPPPNRRKKLASVNYHCSIGRKSPSRSFPPPLPSLCRRDGPCLSMRRHRRDGRLVMEAVPVPSHNYLHAQREGGRLVLTFIETSFQDVYPENVAPTTQQVAQQNLEEEEETRGVEAVAEGAEEEDGGMVETGVEEDVVDNDEEEEEEEEEVSDEEGEEEVEVVDRGIVVEVKVSRPQLPQSGGMKVQRSSVVINKFVGVPQSNQTPWAEQAAARTGPPQRPALGDGTTTTATGVVAVAVAASSSLSTDERYWRNAKGPLSAHRQPSPEKLYFTSKRLTNRQELLHQVRRCSEHHRPLFIWEPCCIATS